MFFTATTTSGFTEKHSVKRRFIKCPKHLTDDKYFWLNKLERRSPIYTFRSTHSFQHRCSSDISAFPQIVLLREPQLARDDATATWFNMISRSVWKIYAAHLHRFKGARSEELWFTSQITMTNSLRVTTRFRTTTAALSSFAIMWPGSGTKWGSRGRISPAGSFCACVCKCVSRGQLAKSELLPLWLLPSFRSLAWILCWLSFTHALTKTPSSQLYTPCLVRNQASR